VRNVVQPTRQVIRTPGYQQAPTARIRIAQLLIGGVCLIAGFVVIVVAG
jgi:hypothetical protein